MFRYDEQGIVKLSSKYLRPRARNYLKWDEILEGDVVMANYNSDEPAERGFWYDILITKKVSKSVEMCIEHRNYDPKVVGSIPTAADASYSWPKHFTSIAFPVPI